MVLVLSVFGLVLSVSAYAPENVSAAWKNHFDAFAGSDLTKIMLDYDTNSILEVYDAGIDKLQTYKTTSEIEGFFQTAFAGLGDPNQATTMADPIVEEPSTNVPFGQVFLVWKSPDSTAKFPAVTDTFVFDPETFKIIRQNVVVFSDMNCPKTSPDGGKEVATTGAVQKGWNNHFAAFGQQNLTKIMQDYTGDSKAMFFDVAAGNDAAVSVNAGTANIEAMFKGLFTELDDRTNLRVPHVATSTFAKNGAEGSDLGMTFLIWRSPTDSYAHVTDTFVYNKDGKIIRQNIVAVKTKSDCTAIVATNSTNETESDASFQVGVSSVVFLFLVAVFHES